MIPAYCLEETCLILVKTAAGLPAEPPGLDVLA